MHPFLLQPQVWELMLPLVVQGAWIFVAPESSAGEALGQSVGGILQLPEGCCQDGNEPKWGWRALQLWLPGPHTKGPHVPGEGASASGEQRAFAQCSFCTDAPSSLSLSAVSHSPGLGGAISISQVRRRPARWRAAGSGFTSRACLQPPLRVLPGCLAAPQSCNGVSSSLPSRDLYPTFRGFL